MIKLNTIKDALDNVNIFDIHFRKKNRGVSTTKNTSIRILLEKNSDIGFLMDDDVLYKDNCFENYLIELNKKLKKNEYSYYFDRIEKDHLFRNYIEKNNK